MKHLHFDCIGGASGDMLLGALADLGVDLAAIAARLRRLPLPDFSLQKERTRTAGILSTRVTVRIEGADREAPQPHRHLSDILGMIQQAGGWPEGARRTAAAVFERLAEAEAKVHGMDKEEVHFHEVGAVDSILDVCGVALAVAELGVQEVSVGPVPLGRGTITCAHGVLPNPAPATLELLKGHPVVHVDEEYETITPTGAALLMELKSLPNPPEGWTVSGVGYGAGNCTGRSRPNLLRAVLLREQPAAGEDVCLLLETAVDDVSAELVGVALEKLLAAGAWDAYAVPVTMKKQRPGTEIRVLCAEDLGETMREILFTETGTLGIREYRLRRSKLQRSRKLIRTDYGPVTVKIGCYGTRAVVISPELEDCRRRAEEKGVPVREVMEAARAAARTLAGGGE